MSRHFALSVVALLACGEVRSEVPEKDSGTKIDQTDSDIADTSSADAMEASSDVTADWLITGRIALTSGIADLDVDPLGNIVAGGNFAGTFGMPGDREAAPTGDLAGVVTKRGTDGGRLWTAILTHEPLTGGAHDVGISGVAVSPTGEVCFVGSDNPENDTGVLVEAIIGVLSADGTELWRRTLGTGSTMAAGVDVVADPSGDFLVVGRFAGTIDFGGGPIHSPPWTVFVARYSHSGDVLWSRTFGGGSGHVWPEKAVLDDDGNLYVVGHIDGTTALGSATLTSTGAVDQFLASIARDGSFRWANILNSPTDFGQESGTVCWAHESASIVVATTFTAPSSATSPPLVSRGGEDILLTTINPSSGVPQRVVSYGTASDDAAAGLTADGHGGIILAGVSGELSTDGGTGAAKMIVVRYASDFAVDWQWATASSAEVRPMSFGLSTGNAFVLGGAFSGTLEFGGLTARTIGPDARDVFLARATLP